MGQHRENQVVLGVKIYTCICGLEQEDLRLLQAAVLLALSRGRVPVLTHGRVAMKRLEAEVVHVLS
jgi:hypothetical protein